MTNEASFFKLIKVLLLDKKKKRTLFFKWKIFLFFFHNNYKTLVITIIVMSSSSSSTPFWIKKPEVLFEGITGIDSFLPTKKQTFAANINAFTRSALVLLLFIFTFGRFFMVGGKPCFMGLFGTVRLTLFILIIIGSISLLKIMSKEGYLYASPSLPGAQFKADKKDRLFSGHPSHEPYFHGPNIAPTAYKDSQYMFLEPEAEHERTATENFVATSPPGRHWEQNYAEAGDVRSLLSKYKHVRLGHPSINGGDGNVSIADGDEMARIGNRIGSNRVTEPRIIDAGYKVHSDRGQKLRPYRYNQRPWY
jgi:hypothetical protein